MIVSHRWLADYVDVDMPLDDLTDRLTKSGLNLEGVEEVTLPSGETDVAIDLEVTSNRPDCLGHVGVAREIATLYGTELRGPDCDPPVSGEAVDGLISVEIEECDLCPRYVARVIRGVKVGPTPAWLRDRLRAIDANYTPVNNVVDATNYVMFETGQPFHAFDLAKVAGPKIVVRRAAAGEQIEAINHETYELKPSFGVIADAEGPVAIAGVMGGAGSEITEGTTDVLLEAAAFGPLDVRNAARSLKLFSPSQYRFERLTDVVRLDLHSRRCAKLILDLAGGELLAGAVDVDVRDDMDAGPITLRTEKVEQLLGTPATREQIDSVFAPLGIAKHGGDAYLPPSWRPDLTREVDLIEEFARVVGYDELDDHATLPVAVATVPKAMRVVDRLRDTLFGYGFSESVTLSFVTADESALFDPPGAGASPLSVEHSSRK
ncbi:MAG: phenylalanine--tRNA ligase subunit beta, partial [Planctomycetota bacterium]